MSRLAKHLVAPGWIDISGAPEGSDALDISKFLSARPKQDVMYIARDETRIAVMAESLSLFVPSEKILLFPAWDCLPYDRVSPNNNVISRRLRTLIDLAKGYESKLSRTVLLTTCNAAFQRIPKRS